MQVISKQSNFNSCPECGGFLISNPERGETVCCGYRKRSYLERGDVKAWHVRFRRHQLARLSSGHFCSVIFLSSIFLSVSLTEEKK